MVANLQSNLWFCRIGRGFVFLDVKRDRYFELTTIATREFEKFLVTPRAMVADFPQLRKLGLIVPADAQQLPDASRLPVPVYASTALRNGPNNAMEVAVALLNETRVRRGLRRGGLHGFISQLNAGQGQLSAGLKDPMVCRAIRAFELAKLLRSPANLCLSRSIALTQRLRALGCHANLVMGVRILPFAAHSWTQFGEIVLNDTCEEVARFQPILIV